MKLLPGRRHSGGRGEEQQQPVSRRKGRSLENAEHLERIGPATAVATAAAAAAIIVEIERTSRCRGTK